jgi:hypothetical protein
VPLVFATGAGAASRQSLGTAVCGGMITATVLAVFFVPVFYVVMQQLSEWRSNRKRLGAATSAAAVPTFPVHKQHEHAGARTGDRLPL